MEIRALSWNLYHGRDFPPDRSLLTMRSRLFGASTRNATHVQVNRDLEPEFAHVLWGSGWDVALLQEAPPHWAEGLAEACGAGRHRALTSRNWISSLRIFVARHRPDLIASNEGGSNLTLVRPAAGAIVERREAVLKPGPSPERRVMAFTRTANGLAIANLHASTADPFAVEELLIAAQAAEDWSGGGPLIFGGDFNVRPRDEEIYEQLADEYGLRGVTADDAIDHLLVRGLQVVAAPHALSAERREVFDSASGLAVRLSDHSPVAAVFQRRQ